MCHEIPPPPPFLAVRFRGQLRAQEEGRNFGTPGPGLRDLVMKRVTLQTGKGLQREGIRDELRE